MIEHCIIVYICMHAPIYVYYSSKSRYMHGLIPLMYASSESHTTCMYIYVYSHCTYVCTICICMQT